jgi:hypothetical protein
MQKNTKNLMIKWNYLDTKEIAYQRRLKFTHFSNNSKNMFFIRKYKILYY